MQQFLSENVPIVSLKAKAPRPSVVFGMLKGQNEKQNTRSHCKANEQTND